jgi:cyclase
VKIFNDKEVDELLLLDIRATVSSQPPQFDLIKEIVGEAFMPLGYGGGIRTTADAARILASGAEKVVVGTAAVENPTLVDELARTIGSQSVVVSVDVRRNLFGKCECVYRSARDRQRRDVAAFATEMASRGAGELILHSVDRDGTMTGYDLDVTRTVAAAVPIPVVACGGARNLDDMAAAIRVGASAVAAGSMFVFHGRHRAVLIQYPSRQDIEAALAVPAPQ